MKLLLVVFSLLAFSPARAESAKGVLFINGTQVTQPFDMEIMFHTAELKPQGTILSESCGRPAELPNVRVCNASAIGSNNPYIVLYGSTENVYVRANATQSEDAVSLAGEGVIRRGRYPVETKYELRITW